ncbi:hypothetical protein KAW64_08905 [bacterium]|nr:hypothetical protein [bacterium]
MWSGATSRSVDAVLMDMAGNRLHEWRMGFADAWAAQPGDNPPASIRGADYWRRAHLFENGDVLAIFEALRSLLPAPRLDRCVRIAAVPCVLLFPLVARPVVEPPDRRSQQ